MSCNGLTVGRTPSPLHTPYTLTKLSKRALHARTNSWRRGVANRVRAPARPTPLLWAILVGYCLLIALLPVSLLAEVVVRSWGGENQ